MFLLQNNCSQQSSSNIIIRAPAYDAAKKITFIPIQNMKKLMHNDNKSKEVILVNDETSTSNPDFSTRIYLTADKVAQYILLYDNRIEKVEAKKETEKNTDNQKLHLQQKRCEAFQKLQDSMNILLPSPTK